MSPLAWAVAWATLTLYLARAIYLTFAKHSTQPPLKTMVVLGSGGHTAEMLGLMRALVPTRLYAPRTYVIATTDHTSAHRVQAFEAEHQTDETVAYARLPRAREVGQSYATSVLTTVHAMLHAMALVLRQRPALVLCNGPGTCIPICAAAIALRVVGIKKVRIVYVESIARVQTLALSGKLLVRVADHFLVQWPALAQKYPRAQYVGRIL